MSEIERIARVVGAVQKRISACGDMHIRVSRHTMKILLKALDLPDWEVGEDEFREVDALALDALRHLAWRRIAI